MVEHLAWPVTVLIILAVVLRNGRTIAAFVKSVRYGDFEINLHENVSEARDAAEQIRVQRQSELVRTHPDTIRRLVEIDPSVAVISEWRRLEHAIIKLIQHNGLMRFTTPSKFVEHLGSIGKLLDSEVTLYGHLRSIRNAAVHLYFDQSLSKGEAAEYSGSVDLLVDRINEIIAEPEYIDIPGPKGSSADQ